MSPEYRTPAFLTVFPLTVTSASTHGNSVPNRFFSVARYFASGFGGWAGGGPNPPPGAGCIAANSSGGISRWIDHTSVKPNSVFAGGFGSSADTTVGDRDAARRPATAQPSTALQAPVVRVRRRPVIGVTPGWSDSFRLRGWRTAPGQPRTGGRCTERLERATDRLADERPPDPALLLGEHLGQPLVGRPPVGVSLRPAAQPAERRIVFDHSDEVALARREPQRRRHLRVAERDRTLGL